MEGRLPETRSLCAIGQAGALEDRSQAPSNAVDELGADLDELGLLPKAISRVARSRRVLRRAVVVLARILRETSRGVVDVVAEVGDAEDVLVALDLEELLVGVLEAEEELDVAAPRLGEPCAEAGEGVRVASPLEVEVDGTFALEENLDAPVELEADLVPEADSLRGVGRGFREGIEDFGDVLDRRRDRVAPADASGVRSLDPNRRRGVRLDRHGGARDDHRVERLSARRIRWHDGAGNPPHRLGTSHLLRNDEVGLALPARKVVSSSVRHRRDVKEGKRVVAELTARLLQLPGEVERDEEAEVGVAGKAFADVEEEVGKLFSGEGGAGDDEADVLEGRAGEGCGAAGGEDLDGEEGVGSLAVVTRAVEPTREGFFATTLLGDGVPNSLDPVGRVVRLEFVPSFRDADRMLAADLGTTRSAVVVLVVAVRIRLVLSFLRLHLANRLDLGLERRLPRRPRELLLVPGSPDDVEPRLERVVLDLDGEHLDAKLDLGEPFRLLDLGFDDEADSTLDELVNELLGRLDEVDRVVDDVGDDVAEGDPKSSRLGIEDDDERLRTRVVRLWTNADRRDPQPQDVLPLRSNRLALAGEEEHVPLDDRSDLLGRLNAKSPDVTKEANVVREVDKDV